jgi:hypothetical protein
MNEPTTDEKIQQLVRAVLEAVDSRLAAVRHELAEFADDVERKHHQILSSISTLERRVEHLEQLDVERAGATAGVRERMQELQARITELEHEAERTAAAAPSATTTTTHTAVHTDPAHTSSLSEISRPLYSPGHTTSQLPIVTDPAIQRITAPPIPPTVAPTMSPTGTHTGSVPIIPPSMPSTGLTPIVPGPTPAARPEPAAPPVATADDDITEDIDIERLTRILDERLSHLTLPHQPEV